MVKKWILAKLWVSEFDLDVVQIMHFDHFAQKDNKWPGF